LAAGVTSGNIGSSVVIVGSVGKEHVNLGTDVRKKNPELVSYVSLLGSDGK